MSKVLKVLAGLAIAGGIGVAANQAGIDVSFLSSNKTEFVSACKTARHRPTHRLLSGQRITNAELTEMCTCMYRILSSGEKGDGAIDLMLSLPTVKANGYYNPVQEMACYVPPK